MSVDERWQAEKEEIYAAHAQLIANQRAYHEAERDFLQAQVTELRAHLAAAYAVVDAVETEKAQPHPQFEAFKAERLKDPEVKAAYDEARARNEAEEAIAGLLPDHQPRWGIQYDGKGGVAHPEDGGIRCFCGWESGPSDGLRPWPKFWEHVASVIAAHMAAPGELTALREEVDQYVFESIPLIAQQRDTAEAERDALRERIRVLAERGEADGRGNAFDLAKELRAALRIVRGTNEPG